jgi:restriction system protein
MANYWVVRQGEGDKYAEIAKKGKYIAIGWSELGNLSWLAQAAEKSTELRSRLSADYAKAYPDETALQVGIGSGQVWRFVQEISVGDIVAVPNRPSEQVLWGQVIGEYEYRKDWKDNCPYPHRRPVKWTEETPYDKLPPKLKNSISTPMTVFSQSPHVESIQLLLRPEREQVTGDKLVEAIIEKLRSLSPWEFEDFVAHLMQLAGFDVEVTPRSGDRGVDIVASVATEGLANITLAVQVKRRKGSVGIGEVLKTRGTLGPDEHGAIVTSSSFTKQAIEEAQKEGMKPVTLVDGEAVVELVLKYYGQLDKQYRESIPLVERDIPLRERFYLVKTT